MYQCKVERVFGNLCRALAIVGGVGLTVMMFLVVANILTRKLFNYPIFGAAEIVSYLSLFIGCIGLGRQEWTDGNIRMTILEDALPVRARCLLEAIVSFICAAGFAIVTRFLFQQALDKWIGGNVTTTLRMPMVYPCGLMAICFAFLTVCIAVKCVLFLISFVKGTGHAPQAPSGGSNAA